MKISSLKLIILTRDMEVSDMIAVSPGTNDSTRQVGSPSPSPTITAISHFLRLALTFAMKVHHIPRPGDSETRYTAILLHFVALLSNNITQGGHL